jgi:tRNA modification GTPase
MIEAEGVRRAVARAEDAHLRLFIHREPTAQTPDFITKQDLTLRNVDGNPDFGEINALSGQGVDDLMDRINAIIVERFMGGEPAGITRTRHANCAERALKAAISARTHLGFAPELVSEDIRTALRVIDELAGRSDIEDVFDRIFSQFCVGK